LVADGDALATYVIDDLEPNTPAIEAVIKGGETLLASTTILLQTFQWKRFAALFRYDGRAYDLAVKQDAETIHVKLKLRRLV